LREAGLLEETAESKLIPARDIRRITLAEILSVVRHELSEAGLNESDHWNPTVQGLTDQLNTTLEGALADRTLADLVDEDESREKEESAAER